MTHPSTPTSSATAGTMLRSLRDRRVLTGRALADRAGVDQSTIARTEAGRMRPSPDVLERLLYELEPTQQERRAIVFGVAFDHTYTDLL